jgi:translation initiation factor 2B subunit (eIF-2B alpha/beta/delta family)
MNVMAKTTAAAVGAWMMIADVAAPGGDAVNVNTLVNAIGAILLGCVAWFVQLGVRRMLARLDSISRRLRYVENNQSRLANKLRIELPQHDEPEAETD